MFQNSNFALINAISVTVIMDQINGWPKQLLCLCAMTGSCREQFGHFVLMSEVEWRAANHPYTMAIAPLFFYISFFCLPVRPSPARGTHFISFFLFYLWTWFIRYCHPSFGSDLSRSDPFIGNYCIFNPDLDNSTVTVIFAPGLCAALRPFLSLTLCIPRYQL